MPGCRVVDLGSGTGILSGLLLSRGVSVFAVEPSAEMAAAASAALSSRPGFFAIDAPAESTGLPRGSIDLVVAAQTFHWFGPVAVRAEVERVIAPGGCVALIWNNRSVDATPFLQGYEALLLQYGTDYTQDGLQGRLLSSSYAPSQGYPDHAPMMAALDGLFTAHARGGAVDFRYLTEVYHRVW